MSTKKLQVEKTQYCPKLFAVIEELINTGRLKRVFYFIEYHYQYREMKHEGGYGKTPQDLFTDILLKIDSQTYDKQDWIPEPDTLIIRIHKTMKNHLQNEYRNYQRNRSKSNVEHQDYYSPSRSSYNQEEQDKIDSIFDGLIEYFEQSGKEQIRQYAQFFKEGHRKKQLFSSCEVGESLRGEHPLIACGDSFRLAKKKFKGYFKRNGVNILSTLSICSLIVEEYKPIIDVMICNL